MLVIAWTAWGTLKWIMAPRLFKRWALFILHGLTMKIPVTSSSPSGLVERVAEVWSVSRTAAPCRVRLSAAPGLHAAGLCSARRHGWTLGVKVPRTLSKRK